jgi:hypothetical protein
MPAEICRHNADILRELAGAAKYRDHQQVILAAADRWEKIAREIEEVRRMAALEGVELPNR